MKIFLIVIGILMIESATSAISQEVDSTAFHRVEQRFVIRSVVRIENTTRSTSGTGFVARDRDGWKYIVTNSHVVERGRKFKLDFHPHNGLEDLAGIEILARDPARDLALMRVKSDASTGFLPLVMKSNWKENECGLRVGFPNRKLKCDEVKLVSKVTRDGHNEYGLKGDFLRMKPGAAGGASGSPIVTKAGGGFRVVAVLRGSGGGFGDGCLDMGSFLHDHGYGWLADKDVAEDDIATLLNASLSLILDELEERK